MENHDWINTTEKDTKILKEKRRGGKINSDTFGVYNMERERRLPYGIYFYG